MVRLALATVAALALVSGSATAQVPTQESVSGSGGAGDEQFTVSATSGPSGENPTGHFDFTSVSPPLHSSGDVTCLNVHGNVAVLQYFDATYSHLQILIRLTDNAGTGEMDILELEPIGSSRSPTDCSPPGMTSATRIFNGDFAVVDAQPPPTSKEQCKQGGYRQFGFRNQGQCVAFVNHPPKS